MGIGTGGAILGASVLGAGASMLSGGSKGSGGSTSTSSEPWSGQQPYLLSGFQSAQDLYNQRSKDPGYKGSLYSPANDTQLGAGDRTATYLNGYAGHLPDAAAYTAGTLQNAATPYMNNALGMAANGAGGPNSAVMNNLNGYATGATPAGGVSSPLSAALESAAVSGAHGIAAGQNTLSAASTRALSDPTQNTISAAGQYANNPALDAQIRAAQQPIEQTLHESTVPGLNRAASMGGNLNSSRAGMAEAMANRDAATQEGNIAASMRGGAYQNGLNLAAQQGEAGTNAAISAGTAQANTGTNLGLGVGNQQISGAALKANTAIGAAGTSLGADLASRGLDAGTKLTANAQLGNATSLGVNAGTASGTQAMQDLVLGTTAGGVSQTDENAKLQDKYNQWLNQNGSYQQGVLGSYMQGIQGNYGQTTNGTSTLPNNPFGNALGGALGGASLVSQGGALSGLFAPGNWSAAQQYANPYGATGNNMPQSLSMDGRLLGGV